MSRDKDHSHHRPGLFGGIRTNFLAGLVVILPIGLTAWLIWTVVGWIDSAVWPFVPDSFKPNALINRWFGLTGEEQFRLNVRGLGVIVFLIFTVIVGWLAKGIVGRSFLRWGEGLVARMPIVRSIYNGAKQIAETIFAQQEQSFETACLVEYPRSGVWAIGFVSTRAKGEVVRRTGHDDLLSVFVPTTPNPTSGFMLFLPERDVTLLDMSIEEAAKLVISAGLVYPGDKDANLPEALEEAAHKLDGSAH